MVLQNGMIVNYQENLKELYCRSSANIIQEDSKWLIPSGTKLSTNTYMAAFDVKIWKKYTALTEIYFNIAFGGTAEISLIWEKQRGERKELIKKTVDYLVDNDKKTIQKRKYLIPPMIKEGILYFELIADEDTVLYEANFETTEEVARNIYLSIVICTYKRKKQLEQLLKKMNENAFLSRAEWIRIKIVDNASELTGSYGRNINVYHNSNTGGSGGFTRGMLETVKELDLFAATNVLLMDDDVDLQPESLIRLYALLSFIKPEYREETIAGRMFRLDRPWVQYTAVEIWNGGDIKHIGWNRDMREEACLWDMNINKGGEYSGWWFACFTIDFIKENKPMPFFLHCDDVEYGLRHGGEPIILNGIQVWHETYEYRQSPVTAYYDMRNPLFVNELYGIKQEKNIIWRGWKENISRAHLRKDYLTEYMLIYGLWDYLKGIKWLLKVNGTKKHEKLCLKKTNRLKNALFWRIVANIFWIKFFVKKNKWNGEKQKNEVQY